MNLNKLAAVTAAAATFACSPALADQGVSANEVLIGTIQDLSGPVASYGKDLLNGMKMRIAEINEHGGIHGRKIKLLAEDNGYDPKKAVFAAQKLVDQEKVFLIAGHLGTAANLAAMPVQFEKNVINFLPISNSLEMYEPVHKLKYGFAPPDFDQARAAVSRLYNEKKASKACALYQDDDFGIGVMRGAEAGLKDVGAEMVERVSYKRGATDFSSQVARLKAAGCDFVAVGTLIRETIGATMEMRKLAYNPTVIGVTAAYSHMIPKLGGKSMDGFYAAMFAQHPYLDDASQPLSAWAGKYMSTFNSEPTVFSVYGYAILERLVAALQKTGPNLTTDSFAKAMESLTVPADIFGIPVMTYTAKNHLGSNKLRISQIQDGRWKVVYDYPK